MNDLSLGSRNAALCGKTANVSSTPAYSSFTSPYWHFYSEDREQVLNVLASRGVKISIDDFGTGYSSLSYLKRLPIAELKIDRSFVDGIATETDDKAIAIAILSLAHTLGLSTVAEGVETAQQLAVLRTLGCDIAQGYFFHKPMEREHFRLLLQSESVADSFVGTSAA